MGKSGVFIAIILAMIMVFSGCSDSIVYPGEDGDASELGNAINIDTDNIARVAPIGYVQTVGRIASRAVDITYPSANASYLSYTEEDSSTWKPVEFKDRNGRTILVADPVIYQIDSSAFFCDASTLITVDQKPVVVEETLTDENGNEYTVSRVEIQNIETAYYGISLYVDIVDNMAWVINADYGLVLDRGFGISRNKIYVSSAVPAGFATYAIDRNNPSEGLVPITSGLFDTDEYIAASDDYVVATSWNREYYGYGYILDGSGRYPYTFPERKESIASAETPDGAESFVYMTGRLENAMITPNRVIYDIYGLGNHLSYSFGDLVAFTPVTETDSFSFALGDPHGFDLGYEIFNDDDNVSLRTKMLKTFVEDQNSYGIFFAVDGDNIRPAFGEFMADGEHPIALRSVVLPQGAFYGIDADAFNPTINGHVISFISPDRNSIFVVDLSTKSYKEIKLSGRVADTDISISNEGIAIYHQYLNAADVGTFSLDLNDPSAKPELMAVDKMDVYQIIPLEDL